MLKGKQLLSYTAGIIDGEGSIGIYRLRNKSKRGFTYDLIVSVWNTNQWLVQWLKMSYGGNIVFVPWSKDHPKWKPRWKWTIRQNKAGGFLKLILPYLQIKRPQAELAIIFQEKKRDNLKNEESIVIVEAQRILMAKMNKKGPEENSTVEAYR